MSVSVVYSGESVEVLVEDTEIGEGIAHVTLYTLQPPFPGLVLSLDQAKAAIHGLTLALASVESRLHAY